jgi:WD40 repeat protein
MSLQDLIARTEYDGMVSSLTHEIKQAWKRSFREKYGYFTKEKPCQKKMKPLLRKNRLQMCGMKGLSIILIDNFTNSNKYLLSNETRYLAPSLHHIANIIVNRMSFKKCQFEGIELKFVSQMLNESINIRAIASHPYKPYVVTNHKTNFIVWNPLNNTEFHSEQAHPCYIDYIAVHAEESDEHFFVATASNKTVKLWVVKNNSIIYLTTLTDHIKPINCMTFSSDGHLVTVSKDGKIRIWSILKEESKCECITIKKINKKNVLCVAIHSLLHIIATGDYENNIKLFCIEEGMSKIEYKITLTGHKGDIVSVAFDPNRNILISGSYDGTMKVWDISKNIIDTRCVVTLDHFEYCNKTIVFHNKESIVISSSRDTNRRSSINVWRIPEDSSQIKCMTTIKGYNAAFVLSQLVVTTVDVCKIYQ